MADIFTEVWNQVRADRARAVWVRFAPYVIVGALLIVGGVGGYEFYIAQRDAGFERAGYVFEDGLVALGERDDEEDDDIAVAKEHFSKAMGSNYAPLASMYLADLELRQADEDLLARERAMAVLEQGSQSEGVWARMARLKLGYLVAEKGTLAEVERVLAPLISTQDHYTPFAREVVAVTASQAGQTSRARAEYQRILDDETTDDRLRDRAEVAMNFIDAAPVVRLEEEAEDIQSGLADLEESLAEAGARLAEVGIPVSASSGNADQVEAEAALGGVFLSAPSLAPGLE